MLIRRDSNFENLKKQAVENIQKLFISNKKKPILFLSSGGSTFKLLDSLQIPEGLRISIGVLDERYSTDQTINNFTQLTATSFFKRSEKLFEYILDTSVVVGESLDEYAERYESLLRTWMVANPQGIIIATVGMGFDGHTSGIIPFPEAEFRFEKLFNDGHKLVVGYDAGNKNEFPIRVTTTFEFLRRIHFAVAYISGINKREAWNKVIAEEGTLAQTPARILKDMEDVTVFTYLD